MARDTNFTKAVKELLGSEPSENTPGENQAGPAGGGEALSGHAAEPGGPPQTPDPPRYETVNQPAPRRIPDIPTASGEATYITKDTIVTGTIESRSHVLMEGQMTGDITTQKDVKVTGKVDGNIDGDNILLNDGAVIGDVTGKADVLVDSTAVVIGNVVSDNFDSDGRIKGSLKVGNSVSLKSNAIIFGNITSRTLNVQDGAVLRGNVQVISNRVNDEDLFAINRKSVQLNELDS